MNDRFGRRINYLRLSVTDRCNLRCRYCIPSEGLSAAAERELLTFQELLSVVRAAASLGIDRFKVTGGEPLLRDGCPDLIRRMKEVPGVSQVTLTTNGILLSDRLPELLKASVDRINISLDTLDETQFRRITGSRVSVGSLLETIERASRQLPVRINAVLLPETASQLIPLASLAEKLPVDVRFIERMPFGGDGHPDRHSRSSSVPDVLNRLKARWPLLSPAPDWPGNGPAAYFHAPGMKGAVGLIEAVSHSFCSGCNRMRLTCTGLLRPCLSYETGIDLKPVLRQGEASDPKALQEALCLAIRQAAETKPKAHCFRQGKQTDESMSRIGG